MEPKIQQNADGSVTVSITIPKPSAAISMIAQEGELMAALNVVGVSACAHLLASFDSDGKPLFHANRKWTSKGRVLKIYESPWGEVPLERHLYQTSEGGQTWCPLEDRACIAGGSATPSLARSLAYKYVFFNARATARDLRENHARFLAPSYVADIAAAVADAAAEPTVEQSAHAPQCDPALVRTLALGLDGTCAFFSGEGQKQCMVGTITMYDAAGERLETIYLGQAPEVGKPTFLSRLDAEWERVCAIFPDARRVGVSDGARDYEIWLKERTTWQVLDFYHASEYLAEAAAGMVRKKGDRKAWLEATCHALKHDYGAAKRITAELAEQASVGSRTRGAAAALDAACSYFSNNVERMNYSVYRAMRMPIGSGVTEAACKTLVKARLCNSGMQWTRSGAQTVLTLRALILSDARWDSLWTFFEKNGY
jgi:hypothetical protein